MSQVSRRALHRSCAVVFCIRSNGVVSGKCYLAGLHEDIYGDREAAQAGVGMAPRKKGACLQGSGSSRLSSLVAVALYVEAWEEFTVWSTCFELAAADTEFRDEAGSLSSADVGGGGLRSASSAPDEQAAALQLLGSQPALEPQLGGSRAIRRKQREVTKQWRAAAAQEPQQLRAWKQARADTGGSVEGSSGKVTSLGIVDEKGASYLHTKARDGKEVYDTGDDKQDKCADVAPGKPCSSGRADVMRIIVEYDRFEHAGDLWNAREVEARVFLRMKAFQTNLYSHVQSMNELTPEALSLPGRSNSSADSPRSTRSATLTEISSWRIPRCLRRSQALVGRPGSRRAQRLWQEFGEPWLPSSRERGHRLSLRSFGTPLTVRRENSGEVSIKGWRRICGQPLREVKVVLYGASPRHSSISSCRLLRWLHHCCSLTCRMISCALGPWLERALARSSSEDREGGSEGPRGGEEGTNPVHRLGRGPLLPCAERFERRTEQVLKVYGRWGLRRPESRRRTHPCVDGWQRQ